MEIIKTRTAAMILKSSNLAVFCSVPSFFALSLYFAAELLGSDSLDKRPAMSQKDFVVEANKMGFSVSGSKIVDTSFGGSMDITSTKWSLRTWKHWSCRLTNKPKGPQNRWRQSNAYSLKISTFRYPNYSFKISSTKFKTEWNILDMMQSFFFLVCVCVFHPFLPCIRSKRHVASFS